MRILTGALSRACLTLGAMASLREESTTTGPGTELAEKSALIRSAWSPDGRRTSSASPAAW